MIIRLFYQTVGIIYTDREGGCGIVVHEGGFSVSEVLSLVRIPRGEGPLTPRHCINGRNERDQRLLGKSLFCEADFYELASAKRKPMFKMDCFLPAKVMKPL